MQKKSYWFFSLKPIVKTKAKDINNNLMKTATVLNSFGWFLHAHRAVPGETNFS